MKKHKNQQKRAEDEQEIKNPVLAFFVYLAVTCIAAIVIWPLLDFLWCAIFTHTDFNYSVNEHLLEPLIFSLIFTLIFYLPPLIKLSRKKSKK
jgi:uncharacterized RDD family membrane protein YckC